jgi:hypothetical protein
VPYTAEKPPPPPSIEPRSTEQLRAEVPGWGVDLDPADRPSWPKERRDLTTGAHWHFPDRQTTHGFRERSIEHEMLTPVFGTSVPLRGLSGVIRRLAYARFSEGRAAHWLLLVAGDRVDAVESHLRSFATARPDNPLTQTGVRAEVTHHGVASRFGHGRVDVRHQWMDPILVAGPWLLAVALMVRAVRRLRRTGS